MSKLYYAVALWEWLIITDRLREGLNGVVAFTVIG